jgi:hypothetical protein
VKATLPIALGALITLIIGTVASAADRPVRSRLFFTTREYGTDAFEPPFEVLRDLVGPVPEPSREAARIGYTTFRTDLPGGRHANVVTMRAAIVGADGKGRRDLAAELTREPNTWTQFAGWSPDGRLAIIGRGWESPENGRWEEEHKTFRKSYQVYVADADGANAHKVETGQPFNFAPQWSPDGSHLLFVAGEHHNCHPHVVRAGGAGLRKLADRGGYRGVIDLLDVPDFHNGSSDIPVWSVDGEAIFHSAKVGTNVELFRVTLDGRSDRLTQGPSGSLHYHPQPSPDGQWLAYGSKRESVRDLYVMRLSDRTETPITRLERGRAAMWPHWEPRNGK